MPINETFLSNTAKVRKLARSVVPADFSLEQIEAEQESAASWIDSVLHTSIETWVADPNATAYKLRIKLEQIQAALFVLGYEGADGSEIAGVQNLMDLAKQMMLDLQGTVDTGATSTASADSIERIPWRDWGHNPDIPAPNKMTKFKHRG